jgi:hypothetical protein
MRRLIMVLVLIGCSVPVFAKSGPAQQVIKEAQQELDKAIALQGGWGSTVKLIKKAKQSIAKGNQKKALELARQAKREAELSYKQAVNQNKHWSEPAYLSK